MTQQFHSLESTQEKQFIYIKTCIYMFIEALFIITEKIQISISWWMDEQNVVLKHYWYIPHCDTLFGNKNITDTYHIVDELNKTC